MAARKQAAAEAPAYDNTNTGIVNPATDKNPNITGRVNAAGTNYQLVGSYDDDTHSFDLAITTSLGNDPFAPPKPSGEMILKPLTPKNENSPNYGGTATIAGAEYRVSGWLKVVKKGNNKGGKFISIRLTTAEEWEAYKQRNQAAAAPQSAGVNAKVDI